MTSDRFMIVSTDSHATAPPEAFRPYLESKYHSHLDDAVKWSDGHLQLVSIFNSLSDERLDLVDSSGAIRNNGVQGAEDVHIRLREMDREGVAAEIMFAGAQIAALPFFTNVSQISSPELQGAGARAYNRWLADRISEAPDRLVGVGYLGPCTDIESTVKELYWLANNGFRSVTVPGMIATDRVPPIMDPQYEPFWSAAADLDLVLSVHAGHGTPQGEVREFLDKVEASARDLGSAAALEKFLNDEGSPFGPDLRARQVLWQLMLAGVFDRHAGLKLALTELRADWIPSTLRYLDQRCEDLEQPLTRRPTEYWSDHCFAGLSFMHRAEIEERDEIGVDTMMFGRDYPHPEGTWPNTYEWLSDSLAGIDEADARAILGENAIRCYGLDPTPLRALADAIGPSVDQILQPSEPVSPALLQDFDIRGGYLRETEHVEPSAVAPVFEADTALVSTSS